MLETLLCCCGAEENFARFSFRFFSKRKKEKRPLRKTFSKPSLLSQTYLFEGTKLDGIPFIVHKSFFITRRGGLLIPARFTTIDMESQGGAVEEEAKGVVEDAGSHSRFVVPGKKGHVSPRGASNLAPPISYLRDFFGCLDDMCDLASNPRGHVPLCIAENKLMTDLLQERLATEATARAAFDHEDVYGYNNALGLPVLREAVADFIAQRFGGGAAETREEEENDDDSDRGGGEQKTTMVVRSDHIAIGTGVISVLSNALFALGSEGDAVLIPAPYYAAFDNDVRAFAGCVPVPVACQNPRTGPTPEDLEAARRGTELRVGFLLLTNPTNPLGTIYSPRVVRDCISWARSRGIETLVDEIYALSILNVTSPPPAFSSVVRITNNDLGTDIHMLWGLSKDFGASGFRIGVLYTQNEVLLEALGNLHTFATVSHPVQRMVAGVLSDDAFVDRFLNESSRRLARSYRICADALEAMAIPYVPARAGIFVYIDLSGLLLPPPLSFDDEERLGRLMAQHARIVLTPGKSQHDEKPGGFRICYAYVPPGVLGVAMERLGRFVSLLRQRGGLGDWTEDPSNWKDII